MIGLAVVLWVKYPALKDRWTQCVGNSKPAADSPTPFETSKPQKINIAEELAYDPANDQHLNEQYFESGFDPTKPTLEIQFSDDIGGRYCTWEMETEDGKQVNVQRCSILLENTSTNDLQNVVIKLEKVIEEELEGEPPYLGYVLRLNPASSHIGKNDKAWLPLISYRKDVARAWISIDGVDRDRGSKEGKMFRPHTRRELHLTVRADGGFFLPARFQCWVDDQGCLRMKRLVNDSR